MKERGQADYLVVERVLALLVLASISFSTRNSIATNESSGKGVEILSCTTSTATVHYANCLYKYSSEISTSILKVPGHKRPKEKTKQVYIGRKNKTYATVQ
jgi:hypothetical protein